MDETKALLNLAAGIGYSGRSPELINQETASPEWKDSGVGDWKSHVPPAVRGAWGRLSDESRYVAYIIAEYAASLEDHDSILE